jgi:hypothetical protein
VRQSCAGGGALNRLAARGRVGSLLRPSAAGLRAQGATYRPADERHEQRESTRKREDGAKPLLQDLILHVAGHLRQRDPGELVYKARAYDGADERQN